MEHATPQRFMALCRSIGILDRPAERAWNELRQRYAEEHRRYHNLRHVDRMLQWLDASGSADDGIELAIWYHDAIYVPLNRENEAQSAQLFLDSLGGLIDAALCARVTRLILATNPAQARSDLPDEARIVDIDLSILGSAPEEYDAYRRAIRREYAAVPDTVFRPGRRALLEQFLSRPVYATPFFHLRLETQARVNLARELEEDGGP